MRTSDVFHSISLFVSLYLFWLLLSGFFTPFLLSAGVGCAVAVVWFAQRMDVVDHEGHPIRLGPKALFYWPWLKLPTSPTLTQSD